MSVQAHDWSLQVKDPVKAFQEVRANDGISLTIEPGEVCGLLGPNGAGKSTPVKQVIGLLAPDSGTISLGPHDLVADPDAARQLCSYLSQAQMPLASLRAREAIDITGRIRGGAAGPVARRRDELIEALDIGEWRDTLGARVSGGVRRLVGFAMVAAGPAGWWSSTSPPTTSTRRVGGSSGRRYAVSATPGWRCCSSPTTSWRPRRP